ncbi:antitoxin [Streptomyces sp. WMMC1477]|uniref:antitoxin n=1 Tax=Streptomyces sp. WMMC1477 TaxID=3015155 RepID=UPI0022B72479|nr:antitoxin [Streptomyces sp. WMMC1477]MCZ7434044.1 antitoxin [Streptomyces sp. WMMC1477]
MLNKLKGMLVKHESKVGQAVDRAAQMADKKTKGKYSTQLRTGSQKARQAVDRLAEEERRRGQGGPGGRPGSGT